MTSAEAADEPDDEEDDKDQANEADSPTVVVPPRASIAVPHASEQEQEHDDHDDDPEHRAPPRFLRHSTEYAGLVPGRRPAALLATLRRPGAHHLAQDRELPGVVRVVVTDDPDSTRQRVSGRARQLRQDVALGIGDHRPQRGTVLDEPGNRGAPL